MPVRRRVVAALVAAVSLCAALTACRSTDSAAGPAIEGCAKTTNIQIATTPYQDSLVMSLGDALGWYKKECLNVTFQNVAFTNIAKIVASGKGAPVGWRTASEINQGYHLDNDLAYLYPWDIFSNGFALMGRPDSNLKTYDDFVKAGKSSQDAISAVIDEIHGKNVITTLNNSRAEVIQTAIQAQGKSLDWVKYTDLDPASGLTAYLRGDGDTYIAGIPQRQTLSDRGYKVLLAGTNLSPPPINGYITTKSYWNANQDALLKLIHVTYEAIRYTNANLDQVAAYISKEYNKQTGSTLTVDNFKAYWQKLETYPANAGETRAQIFTPGAVAYWKTTWDQDNQYFFNDIHSIPGPAPTDGYLGETVLKAYIAKYGTDEKGWDKPSGSLS
ncbi:ABC transporter substrate-binding protein [Amycolatopsis sp. NPDC051903]|uniref:ABC transporter substrate-binding protein n=1 Tax=Amycolatopsis sp. NPDC051903 TaxID=3363936 RepID=UPI003798DF4B